jgi:hypothetical protein
LDKTAAEKAVYFSGGCIENSFVADENHIYIFILFIPLTKAPTILRASDAAAIDDRRADGGGSNVRAPGGHYVEEKVHGDDGVVEMHCRYGRLSAMAASTDGEVTGRRLAKLCGVWFGNGGVIVTDIPRGSNEGMRLGQNASLANYVCSKNLRLPLEFNGAILKFTNCKFIKTRLRFPYLARVIPLSSKVVKDVVNRTLSRSNFGWYKGS